MNCMSLGQRSLLRGKPLGRQTCATGVKPLGPQRWCSRPWNIQAHPLHFKSVWKSSVLVVRAEQGSNSPKKQRYKSTAGGGGTGRRFAKTKRGRATSKRRRDVENKMGFGGRATDPVDVELGTPSLTVDLLSSADEDDLYEERINAHMNDILDTFRFPLDDFQEKSVRHILCGRSVVVCAPTGAGKTAIAEAAATYFLKQGGKVIYTTPLKALSNQKLLEMRERFGVSEAGLQTGDASINKDGSVVVMTTEILRNILYRVGEDAQAVQGNAIDDRLDKVKLVVFDECHYLGDPGRGSVWEEAIINLPPDVLVLAMSATVRNPNDISGWISEVHGKCSTVITKFRPVPLRWHYCLSPGDDEVVMLPLLDAKETALNPRLISPSERVESFAASLTSLDSGDDDGTWGTSQTWGRWDMSESDSGEFVSTTLSKNGTVKNIKSRTLDELIGVLENADPWHKLSRREKVPPIEGTVLELNQRRMLPAIWFIFSRKDCEAAVKKLKSSKIALTSPDEQLRIQEMVEALRDSQPEAVKEDSVDALVSGYSAHHAGCLPGWKLLIERLYQAGLVKIVFATETLAAGINMPAKTTLLTSLSKRRDDGISLLRHNELMQMAGRAGRRGFDTLGHCVIVQSRWDNPDAAWSILRKGPESLQSRFAANYGMALNLLKTRTLGETREFLNRSFSMYLAGSTSRQMMKEIKVLEDKAERILKKSGVQPGAPEDGAEGFSIALYEKLQGRRREEKRAAKLLRAQLAEERGSIAVSALSKRELPQAIGVDLSGCNINDSAYSLPALLVALVDVHGSIHRCLQGLSSHLFQAETKYVVLGADNNIYVVLAKNLAAQGNAIPISNNDASKVYYQDAAEQVIGKVSSTSKNAWQELAGGVFCIEGDGSTAAIVGTLIPNASSLQPIMPSQEGLDALAEQKKRIREVKQEMDRLQGDKKQMKQSRKRSQAFAEAGALLDRAAALRDDLEGKLNGGWRDFENIVRVLETTGAITYPHSQETGESSSQSFSLKLQELEDRDQLKFDFTPLGMVARELRGSNELWLAVALTHPALQTLGYQELAAVVSALVAGDAVSRLNNVGSAYPPSQEVINALEALEESRFNVSLAQMRSGIDFPLCLDLTLSGVVEAWASGLGWTEVTGDCNLDDGDVARLLMRTVDALRQAAFCEHILPPLRSAAKTAARRMNRPPISDLIT